ncbi:Hsp20 family protein [Streptomyces umbrinus]|uniref:Hsp20 family protein n=1 Tax=Streptomyces umbrinus TaxID=67370 RepID=UPI003409EA42
MSGMIERLPGRPPLPGPFGWVEAGFSGVRTAPGLHGIRVEEHLADVARAIRLPAGAQGDKATADYKDGVLTITVPVPETKAGTRTIPVRYV